MTAYELRRHLAEHHDVRIAGADYATLVTIHSIEHRTAAGHTHNDDVGHVLVDQLAWVAFLVVFIIVGLRLLGLAL